MADTEPRFVPALSRDEMIHRLDAVFCPVERNLTSDRINVLLLEFCLNCPDPVAAMDLVIEAPQDSTTESVLEAALLLPKRSPSSYSYEQLALGHPLRNWHVHLRAV
jgi:hypothetical protein